MFEGDARSTDNEAMTSRTSVSYIIVTNIIEAQIIERESSKRKTHDPLELAMSARWPERDRFLRIPCFFFFFVVLFPISIFLFGSRWCTSPFEIPSWKMFTTEMESTELLKLKVMCKQTNTITQWRPSPSPMSRRHPPTNYIDRGKIHFSYILQSVSCAHFGVRSTSNFKIKMENKLSSFGRWSIARWVGMLSCTIGTSTPQSGINKMGYLEGVSQVFSLRLQNEPVNHGLSLESVAIGNHKNWDGRWNVDGLGLIRDDVVGILSYRPVVPILLTFSVLNNKLASACFMHFMCNIMFVLKQYMYSQMT